MSEQPGPPAQPEDRPGGRPAGEPPAGPTPPTDRPPQADQPPQADHLQTEQAPQTEPMPPAGPAGPGQAQRTGWRALWLGAIALLTAFFFYPLGLVLGVAALVVGIRARRSARRARGAAPGAVPGIVLGSIGLAFSMLSVAVTAFLWTELSGYQSCLSGSNTTADKQSCRAEYYPKIEDKLGLPAGSMDKYGDLL
ncbi:hypothetical protein E1287_33740 [Actinomadura sp. KC06]|uniref:hypothetical protein n=1 Tax=Actinomadura sp. KC06 TaxID=2530369 RepID=UPI0010450504|nr:hypothetical protein [Actinomadura sp. KC06]TDD27869.1 hypothetical protein E1287_33740 [Actinomadura sp. KC06]